MLKSLVVVPVQISHHGLCTCARVPDWDSPIFKESEQRLPKLGLQRVLASGLIAEQFGGDPVKWFG